MARREQTGTGGGRNGHASGTSGDGRRRTPRKPRTSRTGRHTTRRAAGSAQPTRATRSSPAAAEHPSGASAWRSASGAASLSPLRTLADSSPLPAAALALVGAEQTTVSAALREWTSERDLAANRAWRRPGGLTRMAGL